MKAIGVKKLLSFIQYPVFFIAVFGSGIASAEEVKIGFEEFRLHCSTCHGQDAKGNGPMAQFLKIKPADLTVLAKNNTGQYETKAGQYPFHRVFQIIDGRTQVSGHGVREMPIWGGRYQEEIGDKYGPYGGEAAVRGRILELVYYLQTIQVD
ncbi:cytochrome c [Pseudomonas sp. MMS21-TM103]|uniref:c-type cytochrome n=1 Tax=unclassified Pseudomonas TaxID=196821 RepID=UPI001EDDD58C|nr:MULTISPECIES: cytochrome c [unclassified Pseudomonas]MCG4455837.1 cytochrome c [Pseudomonas sp. MMS21 TM103]